MSGKGSSDDLLATTGPDVSVTQPHDRTSSQTHDSPLTPNMLALDTDSAAGPSGCGWSISSCHTLTRAHHAADAPEPMIQESETLGQDTGTGSPEPEVDEIDDLVFMSFETLEDIEKYTRANENKQKKKAESVFGKKEEPGDMGQPSSAFMSKSLDQYLEQTFDELQRKPLVRRPASSPPRDSRIFETGALKMDMRSETVRKPFADLPKLTPVRDTVNLVSRNNLSGVENQPIVHKTPVENSLKKRTDTQLADFDPEKIGSDLREKTFARVVSEAAKERILSLEAVFLTPGPLVESPKKKVKKSNKKWTDDYSPPKSSKDTDLVAMISRKRDSAKRDIRLPSRYQESALIEGNQFICAAPFGSEYHVHDKKSSKRLIEEQKRLQVVKYPFSKPMPHTDVDHQPVVRKPVPKKSAPVSSRPAVHVPPATTTQPIAQTVSHSPQVIAGGSNLTTARVPTSSVPMPVKRESVSGKVDMKQLYRELFFECSPERRAIFHKKGIKPRVHKQQAVEEAIEVIIRLEMREKQLLYIKKLLTLWHRKLDLCSQVISNKIRLEPNQTKDTATVVTSVLHAYQTSVCYKISSIVEKQFRNSKSKNGDDSKSQDSSVRPAGGVKAPQFLKQMPDSGGDETQGPDSQKRIKKIRSQSLLLPKYTLQNGVSSAGPAPSIPVTSGSVNGTAGPVRRCSIVDVNAEAHDLVINGTACRKFVWSNNQILSPDDSISRLRAESSAVAPIIVSTHK